MSRTRTNARAYRPTRRELRIAKQARLSVASILLTVLSAVLFLAAAGGFAPIASATVVGALGALAVGAMCASGLCLLLASEL